MSNLLKRAR
jgi:hypothetical protein